MTSVLTLNFNRTKAAKSAREVGTQKFPVSIAVALKNGTEMSCVVVGNYYYYY